MTLAVLTTRIRKNDNDSILWQTEETMSSDLPTEDLGEAISSAISAAWAMGHDPTTFHVTIHFK